MEVDKTNNFSEEENTQHNDTENVEVNEQQEIANLTAGVDKLDLEGLLSLFHKAVEKFHVSKLNDLVNTIKKNYDTKLAAIVKEKKEEFIASGGEEIDFKYNEPSKSKFDELFQKYKASRSKHYKQLETEQNQNLDLRLSLIEELKKLIENAEPSTMFKEFQVIQERWKSIGYVPKEKMNDLWNTYHHHVERFFDLLHLNNEYRDIEFKKNLESKEALISQVEALSQSENVSNSFKILQEAHDKWKQIGPVAKEKREEIWKRFSELTKVVHEKRHAYQEVQKQKQKENAVVKHQILDELQAFDTSSNASHNDWQKSIKDFEAIKEKYFSAGRVLKSDNDKLWVRFKEITREFNRSKNAFYKQIKKGQDVNLEKKRNLVAIAVENKDSEDWEATSKLMKDIQSDWKKVGNVSRKYSDKLWKEFQVACNHFFDKYNAHLKQKNVEAEGQVAGKKAYLDELKALVNSTEEITKDSIDNIIEKWKSLGDYSSQFRHLEDKFSKTLEQVIAKISGIDNDEKQLIHFTKLVELFKSTDNDKLLAQLQINLRKRRDEIKKEIIQLENNISFFSSSKGDNPLLKQVKDSIEALSKELDLIVKKEASFRD